ncbi:MAG: hypothetical protein AB7U82_10955 [Blastocatellales bacterium]
MSFARLAAQMKVIAGVNRVDKIQPYNRRLLITRRGVKGRME